MESKILSAIGIDIDPGLLFIIFFFLFIIILIMLISLLIKYSRLRVSYETFMQGRDAKSLEEELKSIFDDISLLKITSEKNKKDIVRIINDLRETLKLKKEK